MLHSFFYFRLAKAKRKQWSALEWIEETIINRPNLQFISAQKARGEKRIIASLFHVISDLDTVN